MGWQTGGGSHQSPFFRLKYLTFQTHSSPLRSLKDCFHDVIFSFNTAPESESESFIVGLGSHKMSRSTLLLLHYTTVVHS